MHYACHGVAVVWVESIETTFQDFFIMSYHLILELQLFDDGLIFDSVGHALTRGIAEFFI